MASRVRALAFLLVLLSPLAALAQQTPATERVVLVVEVLTRDPRPVIACGQLGPQPRDVTARVLAVQEGHFDGATIQLSWPMCEFSRVDPGSKFKIRIVRRAGQVVTPSTRYLVRWSDPVRE